MSLREFLKKKRIEAGIGQSSLAKSLKMMPQQLCNIEKGAAPLPIKSFKKIAKLLDVEYQTIKVLYLNETEKRIDRLNNVKNSRKKS